MTAGLFDLELAEDLTATLLTILEIGFFTGLTAALETAFAVVLTSGLETPFAVSLPEGCATDLAFGLATDLGVALATGLAGLEDLEGLATGFDAALGLGFAAAIVFFLPSD